MVFIGSVALGDLLFGALNDLTEVWFPSFFASLGLACASVLYRKISGKAQNAHTP